MELMKQLKKLLEEEKDCILAVIIEGRGSAPREAGACMTIGPSGRLFGTIGGGMLEKRCIDLGVKFLEEKKSSREKFCLSKKETADLGMICGGDVEVLFSFISQEAKNNLRGQLQKGETKGIRENLWFYLPVNGDEPFFQDNESQAVEKDRGFFHISGKPCYGIRLVPQSKVFIFGGGHLAQETVPLLSRVGFRCIVIDDREEFSRKELFPEAEETWTVDFEKLAGKFVVSEKDYICVMTRGHLGDTEVLKYALTTPACYIGAVGSRAKKEIVNKRLKEYGFTENQIKRIISPIGLDIFSETPAEIGVSIAAQLILVRGKQNRTKTT